MNKPINIQTFVCEISKCPDIQRLKSENEELFKECENDKKRVYSMKVLSDKYKQALEEVREIINSYCHNMYNGCYSECINHEIKQKINEVFKDERN